MDRTHIFFIKNDDNPHIQKEREPTYSLRRRKSSHIFIIRKGETYVIIHHKEAREPHTSINYKRREVTPHIHYKRRKVTHIFNIKKVDNHRFIIKKVDNPQIHYKEGR